MHRSQGATVDIAHTLEDGGGRELGYVAMSRARHSSYIYVPSPTVDEAVDRLAWAWGVEHRQTWAIDQTSPTPIIPERIAQLEAHRRQLRALIPPDPDLHVVATLDHDLANLSAGTGRWTHTSAGQARALAAAHAHHDQAAERSRQPDLGPLQHLRAVRDQRRAERNLAHAQTA